MPDKLAIVLRGPPCGGKSTVGCEIARSIGATVRFISLDEGWGRGQLRYVGDDARRYADLESEADALIIELGFGEPEGEEFHGATMGPGAWLRILRDSWRTIGIFLLQPPSDVTQDRIARDRAPNSRDYFSAAARRYAPGGVCEHAAFKERIGSEFDELVLDTSSEPASKSALRIIDAIRRGRPTGPATSFGDFISELNRDLALLWNSILELTSIDDIYWQVRAIVDANSRFDPDGMIFQDWMRDCYAYSVAVGIRRLADTDSRTMSLHRLLGKVKRRAQEFTRSWYAGLHEPVQRESANAYFSSQIGGASDALSATVVKGKQEELRASLRSVSDYVDQHVAHHDVNAIARAPTFDEVRASLVSAFRVHQWLRGLIDASSAVSPVATIQCNWLRNFRIPWLGERQSPPRYVHLEELLRRENSTEGT